MTEQLLAEYVAGSWTAVAASRSWLLLSQRPASPVVGRIWEALRGGGNHLDVLQELVADGWHAFPDFAMVTWDDAGVVAVVRGAAAIFVGENSGTVLRAEQVTTWAEHRLVNVSSLHLRAEMPSSGEEGSSLPLGIGVVQASEVRIANHGRHPTPVPVVQVSSEFSSNVGPLAATNAVESTQSPIDALPTVNVTSLDEVDPLSATDSAVELVPTDPLPPEAGYDYLFGATEYSTVEDAAVRPEDPTALPVEKKALSLLPFGDETLLPEPELLEISESAVNSEPLDVPETRLPREAPRLIDSVPWVVDTPTRAQPVAQSVVRDAERVGGHREAGEPMVDAQGKDESDGLTINRSAQAALLRQMNAPGSLLPSGPTVPAVRCPQGHPNPPHAEHCRTCESAVAKQDSVTIPRPPLGVLLMSTGDSILLDRGVVMGRSPSSDRHGVGERPHLVKLSSPQHDISRTHLSLRLDGWSVILADLGSTNGTFVTRPGESSERLSPEVEVRIEPGTLVNLANEVTFRYDTGA